ncbi:6295_t:CDS:2, partial [Funneliformis caledonium]
KDEEIGHSQNQTYRNIHLRRIRRLMNENYIPSSGNPGCDTEITDDDKYLSQYDICGLVELEQKIRDRNSANNLNSTLMLKAINNLQLIR